MDTNSVLSILLRYVNGQYKKDTNYDIALALLTHYSEIPKIQLMKYQIYAMFHQHQFHVLLNLLDFILFKNLKTPV